MWPAEPSTWTRPLGLPHHEAPPLLGALGRRLHHCLEHLELVERYTGHWTLYVLLSPDPLRPVSSACEHPSRQYLRLRWTGTEAQGAGHSQPWLIGDSRSVPIAMLWMRCITCGSRHGFRSTTVWSIWNWRYDTLDIGLCMYYFCQTPASSVQCL